MAQPEQNQKNKKIFIAVFFVFLAIVIGVTIDMASRTTAPWNKKKQIIRAWDGDKETSKDTLSTKQTDQKK